MANPYDVLGVQRDADQDTIKRAFKKLARKYHPDVSKDPRAEERFKEVNAAYDAVGDPEKRKLYDEFGDIALKPGFDAEKAKAWRSQGGFPGGSGGFPGGAGGFPGGFHWKFDQGEDGGVDMDDLLSSLFGANGRTSRPKRGRNQTVRLAVDPMTSFLGGEMTIGILRPSGNVEHLSIRVPAGAKDGGKLKLAGQGLPPATGGACGDLYVALEIPEHPLLKRNEDDLEMEVPLTVLEAIRGARITVPTPTGDVKVSIPSGAESGQRLRLKGRGVQRAGKPGDLYLVLRPTVPKDASPGTIAAAEALEAAYSGDVRRDIKL